MDAKCVFQAHAALAENPTWDWRSQRHFWLDIPSRFLCRWDPATGKMQSWPLPDGAGCFALTGDESKILLALNGGGFLLDLERGALDQVAGFSARQATMVAFGGPDLRTVYVTTANRPSPSFPDVGEGAGGIFSFESDTPGLPEALAGV